MIWLRRSLAVLLALVFVALYIPVLAVFRVNSTAFNSRFYVDRLHEADVYNYAYDTVLPSALHDLEEEGGATSAGNVALFESETVAVARKSLPPEWIEEQAQAVIASSMRYLLGDIDSFSVNIPVADRVRTAASAIKASLHKPEVFQAVYDVLVSQVVDRIADSEVGSEFTVDRQELDAALRTAMPPEWTLQQIDNLLDQVIPYLVGDQPDFSIKIDLASRLDSLQTIIVDAFKTQGNHDNFLRTISESTASGHADVYALPVGLVLTQDDVLEAMKSALSVEWYENTVGSIADQAMLYVSGEQPALRVVVPLADRKQVIGEALAAMAERKLCAYYDSLPVASPQQLAQFLASPTLGKLPDFRLSGMSCTQLQDLLQIDLKGQVKPVLAAAVPDQWIVTAADFKDVLGSDVNLLEEARFWVQDGLVIDAETLRSNLGDDFRTFEEVRNKIVLGVTFDEQDLRQMFIGDESMQGDVQQESLTSAEDFDRIRGYLGTFRDWKLVLWIIPALVLLGIGLLAGRHWSSRLIWSAGVLLLTALATYIIFGPVYSHVVQPHIDSAISQISVNSPVAAQAINAKVAEIAGNSVDSFVSGLRGQSLMFLFTAVALVALGIVLRLQERRENGNHRDHYR